MINTYPEDSVLKSDNANVDFEVVDGKINAIILLNLAASPDVNLSESDLEAYNTMVEELDERNIRSMWSFY